MWTGWDDLTEKILPGRPFLQVPDLRSPHAAVSGQLPVRPRDSRLARHRAPDGQAAGPGMSWQEYAFHRMVEANPFPSMMGRVCPAPCEDGCNRNEVEDFVGINAVEQYVGDWAIQRRPLCPVAG
jgi:glutamate synthase (NADPH) small chain